MAIENDNRRALLVDQDEESLKKYTGFFQTFGYTIFPASSLEDILDENLVNIDIAFIKDQEDWKDIAKKLNCKRTYILVNKYERREVIREEGYNYLPL